MSFGFVLEIEVARVIVTRSIADNFGGAIVVLTAPGFDTASFPGIVSTHYPTSLPSVSNLLIQLREATTITFAAGPHTLRHHFSVGEKNLLWFITVSLTSHRTGTLILTPGLTPKKFSGVHWPSSHRPPSAPLFDSSPTPATQVAYLAPYPLLSAPTSQVKIL